MNAETSTGSVGGAESERLPLLYCIIDAGCFSQDLKAILAFTSELLAGGAQLIQYRNKNGSAREMLSHGRELRRVVSSSPKSGERRTTLIMNDRADLALAGGFDGVHIGQDDISAEAARRVIQQGIVGVSTHNVEQVRAADASGCDYIAIGPVFATGSKRNPDAIVGVEGVRRARAATRKLLVAIGGITRANCREVIAAGADSVAVIGDLLREPQRAVAEFIELLGP